MMVEGVQESRRQKVGMYVALFSVLIPGLVVAGFTPVPSVPLWVWLSIAGLGGMVGGGIWDEARPWLGALAGGLFGVLALGALPAYVALRSGLGNHYFSLELLIPVGLAVVPSWGLYRLVDRLAPSDGLLGKATNNPFEPPRGS